MATTQKRGRKHYAIYRDAAGKWRQKAGYTDQRATQQLADRLENESRAIALGDVDPQAEVRRVERAKQLPTQIAEYRVTLEAGGRDRGTVAYVIGDIEALANFAAVEKQPLASAGAISWPLVDQWVADQQKRQRAAEAGNANKTINRRVGSIQQFLRHLAEQGGVTSYVLKRYPKLPTGDHHKTRKSRALTAEEFTALLGDFTPKIRRDLYMVAARSGLRMNELRQMRATNFADKLIHVPAHVAKAKRDQTIPMNREVEAIVKRLVKTSTEDQPLFSMPTKRHVIRQLREDAAVAGISRPQTLGFHSLRHTFCTMLARKGVHPALLQRLARHRDIATTLRYYVHLQRSDELTAINTL